MKLDLNLSSSADYDYLRAQKKKDQHFLAAFFTLLIFSVIIASFTYREFGYIAEAMKNFNIKSP